MRWLKMNIKQILYIVLIFSVVVIVGCSSTKYDSFAQCLTEKGVKMYGAYWCPHCANQKDIFGNSFGYVNYIECSLPNRGGKTEICIEEDIKVYPTWEFADGNRKEKVHSLEQLSAFSGCSLE